MEGQIVLKNIEHTLGNLLSSGLQIHPNIDFAGYNMPHPLDNKILIHFKLNKGDIKSAIIDVIKYYKELFQKLDENIQKI